jgi:hypothetical protein
MTFKHCGLRVKELFSVLTTACEVTGSLRSELIGDSKTRVAIVCLKKIT